MILASQGLTNGEIADRLFLSPRTVASHLYHSYPKLGIAGRHQLRDLVDHRRSRGEYRPGPPAAPGSVWHPGPAVQARRIGEHTGGAGGRLLTHGAVRADGETRHNYLLEGTTPMSG